MQELHIQDFFHSGPFEPGEFFVGQEILLVSINNQIPFTETA